MAKKGVKERHRVSRPSRKLCGDFMVDAGSDAMDAPNFAQAKKLAREVCRGTGRWEGRAQRAVVTCGGPKMSASNATFAEFERKYEGKPLYECAPQKLNGLSGNRCRRKDGRFKACKPRRKKR